VNVIEVRGIYKSFGPTRVLHDVNLEVGAGEHLAILGPSGVGKTTLLRLIAGLEYPDAGEVRLEGEVASTPDWVLEPHKRHVGLVFQSGALWPHMSVRQNVLFGLHSMSGSGAQRRCDELLSAAGIEALGERYPDQLSAGQARRVALVRTLAPMPRVILLDEPLVNVEPELRDRLAALVVAEATHSGVTTVHVTHDHAEAELTAGRRVYMRFGRLEEDPPASG